MRQKQLIAPETPSLDRAEYKFNPLFSRLLSFTTALVILVIFLSMKYFHQRSQQNQV
jgi:hypothetical protein